MPAWYIFHNFAMVRFVATNTDSVPYVKSTGINKTKYLLKICHQKVAHISTDYHEEIYIWYTYRLSNCRDAYLAKQIG